MFTSTVNALLQQEILKHRLPADFLSTIENWYFPIAKELAEKHRQKQQTILVNVNGSQGSGKSTLTAFLSLILTHHFGLNTVDISIDDFYLSKAERLQLAEDIHPLFATRGVPGTHDVPLAVSCMQKLLHQQPCSLPQFDKANDDRASSEHWKQVDSPVDIILFEGWCIAAPFQTDDELQQPVNELEKVEDEHGLWRKTVNEELKNYHQQLFSLSDYLLFLQIPGFEKVYEWRWLQEQKLALTGNQNSSVMSQQQVHRFIQHYERITRNCLKTLPGIADMIIKLNDDHTIKSLDYSPH